ncbi:MAG: hypothetical protein PHV34_21565 [Verrucomicrobiae bacterium]|nr:hypothetical protein [Verrucomicrobiae bacterium]
MHWIDWLVVAIPFIIVTIISWSTKRYVKSVADFMAASRCAGRYLVCNASGEAAFGAVSAVALFEMYYRAGFTMTWWGYMLVPVSLILTLTGYAIYRYRETRVMTLAQYFEIRYSKRFRVLAGIVAFISGVLNFGIFPCVAARFFVNYCGMPQNLHLFGHLLPTYIVVMAVGISLALFYTLLGGQLTIMISDCLEGLMSGIFYVVIAIALLCIFNWPEILTSMATAPKGQSMLNPYDTDRAPDFNFWYVAIGLFGAFYSCLSWQGGHAFRASAANAHEAKMGNILGAWRGVARGVMLLLLGICAYTYLNHPDFAQGAAQANEALKTIENPQVQNQMRSPVAISHMLPIGIKGMFCAIIFFHMLACDGSYMHSWGSIFIQDVILPFRKKPFSPRQHIRLLRWCIAGVGVYAFIFGWLYQPTEYILMFFAITGAIFSGAGAAIIGGLYWRKGTTAGAWCAMIAGSGLAVSGMTIQQIPFDHLKIQIETPPGATAVTINGKPAEKSGDRWTYRYAFTRKGEWQSCNVVANLPDRSVTNTLHYAFAEKPADPLKEDPSLKADTGLTVQPANGTMAAAGTGWATRLFIRIRSINSAIMNFYAMVSAALIYVIVSLLTCKEDFNLDRMLHRGKYAVEKIAGDEKAQAPQKWSWGKLIGFDRHFTLGDKLISGSMFFWNMIWFSVFIVGVIWNFISPWPLTWWGTYWSVTSIWCPLIVGVVTTVWFTWGGIRDLRRLFIDLPNVKQNAMDDGTVVNHHSLGEEEGEDPEKTSPPPASRS